MDYVEKIEVVLDNLEKGIIDKYDAGVTVEEIVINELETNSLSFGEMVAIEEELNAVGTSIYEDKYYELQETLT